jgi:hypothetical protein
MLEREEHRAPQCSPNHCNELEPGTLMSVPSVLRDAINAAEAEFMVSCMQWLEPQHTDPRAFSVWTKAVTVQLQRQPARE